MNGENKLFPKKKINSGENHSTNSTKKVTESIDSLLKSNIILFKTRTNYELMYEAFYISNLFYEMLNTKYHLKDPYFYLLDLEWFIKWKKYVNFDFYTRNKNYKRFLSINSLPFRPIIEKEDNYLKNIGQNTQKKIFDFFDKIFLSNNAKLYPGIINNKQFLVDKGQNRTFLYNYHLENNLNVVNDVEYNRHYIWVSEYIWKY